MAFAYAYLAALFSCATRDSVFLEVAVWVLSSALSCEDQDYRTLEATGDGEDDGLDMKKHRRRHVGWVRA